MKLENIVFMYNIIVIIGLPGSGKTEYSKNFSDYELFDDMGTNIEKLDHYKQFQNIVITCPFLCNFPKNFIEQKIKEFFGNCHITFYAFENDLNQCLKKF